MKGIWLAIMTMVFMATLAQGENTLLPSCTLNGSIAPYVDKDGYVNPIIDLGNIDFGNGLSCPAAWQKSVVAMERIN